MWYSARGRGYRPCRSVGRSKVTSCSCSWETPQKDLDQLIAYAQQMKNGAIFKRLGWLLERGGGTDATALAAVRARLTAGNAKIDARLACDRLITRWRLWVPKDDAPSRA